MLKGIIVDVPGPVVVGAWEEGKAAVASQTGKRRMAIERDRGVGGMFGGVWLSWERS